ncbi:MAG: hypothetical protein JWR85_1444, partial [Marmoricola sp.]|nr:hypothetical protein [Marmoricola sp.]
GEQLPTVIRQDGIAIISQLCDPVPHARQPVILDRRNKPGPPDLGLLWLIRRADILSRRLHVGKRSHRYKTTKNDDKSRSA